jgi:hypothetical protein
MKHHAFSTALHKRKKVDTSISQFFSLHKGIFVLQFFLPFSFLKQILQSNQAIKMAEIETAAPVSNKQYFLKHHCDFMLLSMSMDIGYHIIVVLSTSSSIVVDNHDDSNIL